METKRILATIVILFLLFPAFTQEFSRKAKREKERMVKQLEIDSLMNIKEFEFVATSANPQGGSSIDLTTNSNSVKFLPDSINSYMPFFGRAYSIDYGGDGGLKFAGKPAEFKIIPRQEKKGFEIDATVNLPRDQYKLNLFVGSEGIATMTITSNQRSPITYFGNIRKIEDRDKKTKERRKQN